MVDIRPIEEVAPARPACSVRWLGAGQDYRAVWRLQQELAARRLAGEIPDTLLLLEHSPTLTLGRAAHREHVVATAEDLARLGVELVESDRGGDVTYHGPGQLVGYPILNLQETPHRPDLHLYLRSLEEALILGLARFGIEAGRFPGYTGVWSLLGTGHPLKVAAIGVKASRWITQHGFALNVTPNLSHFDLIVPCGIRDYGVTSMAQLLKQDIAVSEVLPVIRTAFADVFGLDCGSTG